MEPTLCWILLLQDDWVQEVSGACWQSARQYVLILEMVMEFFVVDGHFSAIRNSRPLLIIFIICVDPLFLIHSILRNLSFLPLCQLVSIKSMSSVCFLSYAESTFKICTCIHTCTCVFCIIHEGRRKTPKRQGKLILRRREARVMGVMWREQRGRSHVREKDHRERGTMRESMIYIQKTHEIHPGFYMLNIKN